VIESGIRGRIRERIEELVEQELASALRRPRHQQGDTSGHRHGCVWPLTGSCGLFGEFRAAGASY
jgi:hypothetical protein